MNDLINFVSLPLSKATPKEIQEYVFKHIIDGNKWHPLPFHIGEVTFPIFKIGNYTFDKGLHAFMLILAALFCIFMFVFVYRKRSDQAPKGVTNLLESLVLFVRNDICYHYLGKKDGERFAPFFLNFFFFILIANLMGLIPLFATSTANLGTSVGFSLITFSMMIIGGIFRNGFVGFIKGLVPSGVPSVFVPMLFFLELIGLLVKPFALMMRLFANMLAGHMVISFLIGLVMILGYVALPALFLALFIYILELLVAFIQAYVFTLLSAMFFGSMLHPNH